MIQKEDNSLSKECIELYASPEANNEILEMEQKNLLLENTNGNTIDELVNTIKKYNLPLDYSNISVKKALEMLKNICK